MTTGQDSKERVRKIFKAVEARFNHLKASWAEYPESGIDVEITFDVQPGLMFPVVANLQGNVLSLWVGDSFSTEWCPCSDVEQAGEFQSCFQGVLLGHLRLVESSRNGDTFEAKLQDHASGRWRTVATWAKLRWPSFKNPEVRALRNRPLELKTRGLDGGLIADLRDNEISTGDVYAKACEKIRREARHEDLPMLRSLLADQSALVREAVAWPIADLEGLPALRDLLVAYQRGLDDGQDNDGFTALILDMVTEDTSAARDHLRSLARDADSQVRENALWLLSHCEEVQDGKLPASGLPQSHTL